MEDDDDRLTDREYEALAGFRKALREFQAFSSSAAQACGLPTQQHQALLVIRAAPKGSVVGVGMIAEELLIAPHTAAELVGRLESAGLVSRAVDPRDARRVALSLRPKARKILSKLSRAHLEEIRQLVPKLISTLQRISGEEKNSR